jgi:hypothetical protein
MTTNGTPTGVSEIIAKLVKWAQVFAVLGGVFIGAIHYYNAFQDCKKQAADAYFMANRAEAYLYSKDLAYYQITDYMSHLRTVSNPVSK